MTCPGCRKPFESSDHDPFCSSCVDAGWDIAYRRGVEDVRGLIAEEAAKVAAEHAIKFEKTITQVRQSFQDMRLYCIGCTVMKSEGARSYTERAPVSPLTGCCVICWKPRKP